MRCENLSKPSLTYSDERHELYLSQDHLLFFWLSSVMGCSYYKQTLVNKAVENNYHMMARCASKPEKNKWYRLYRYTKTFLSFNPNWHEAGHFPPPCPFWNRFFSAEFFQKYFFDVKIDINRVDICQAHLVL